MTDILDNGEPDEREDLSNLIYGEDGGELLFTRWPDQLKARPLLAEGRLEEELDPAQSDSGSWACVLLDILDVEEILSKFFLGDEVRRFAEGTAACTFP